jgi:hypothetical protein
MTAMDSAPTELDVKLRAVVREIIAVARNPELDAEFLIEDAVRQWGAKAYRAGMARTVEITNKYWRDWPIEMPE